MRAPRSANRTDGSGSNDAGSAGHDGHPAVEANSIGHFWGFLWLLRFIPDFGGFAPGMGIPCANESDYFI